MELEKPQVGRPKKIKTLVLEWLGERWVETALCGLVWLWLGGGDAAWTLLALSGLLWWLGSLVDIFWP
jgi:hypothetical protein